MGHFGELMTDASKRLFPEDNRKGLTVVELIKEEETLGLIISGGIDKGCRPKISHLRPGSVAYRSDCLAIGDYIISINGIQTSKLKFDEIVTLLKNARDKITLEVEYEIPPSHAERSTCLCPKIIQLQLEKENDSYGFTLRGGTCSDKLKSRPLTITHVRLGGPADCEGCIKYGDRLLAVEGINLAGVTQQEAVAILQQSVGPTVLTIEYDVSVIDAVQNAAGPLLVEIDKAPGSQLGINLTHLPLPDPAIVIESIRQASVAERCGALHVGDHILSIDGLKTDLMSATEAMKLLRSSSKIVKLEIFPLSQMVPQRIPINSKRRGGTIPHYVAARASITNSCYNTLSSLGSFSVGSIGQFSSVTPPIITRNDWDAVNGYCRVGNHIALSTSNASLVPSRHASYLSMDHADTTEVILPASHKGFGFTVQLTSADMCSSKPFISSIEAGSPAEKSGVLQVGDRILAINGEYVELLDVEEIRQLILHSHPKLLLKIEFNVAEAVVPSSGTFVVKLAKPSEVELGITVTAPANRQAGEPLIISAVSKGSIAHRSGTIQPGDELLAVDDVRMENCTVDDAKAILVSCNNVVTLRIRKDESFSDDPDVTSATIYTVELARHGGPLGITVSGAEESFVPISISGLTENGLAERTGALHVGDRILAINGTCLRGKVLSEAIQILQTCGDVVTLKISRCPSGEKDAQTKWACSDIHTKVFTTPLPSVDSALESWDSCNLEIYNGGQNECKFGECFSRSNLFDRYSTIRQSTTHLCSPDHHTWNAQNLNSFRDSQLALTEDTNKEWSKALEDLQTCGESQLLHEIECKILCSEDSVPNPGDLNLPNYLCHDKASKCPSDTLSGQSLQELNAQLEQLGNDLQRECGVMSELTFSRPSCSHDYANQFIPESGIQDYMSNSSFAFPLPIEVHKVTLFKDKVYEDFGFSVSDGLYEHGVYINRIRAGGPADVSGLIKPYDRILQVNHVKTYNHECCLTVPLIAASGDRIELVISRPAYEDGSLGGTFGRGYGHRHWLESTDHTRSLSSLALHQEPHTVTKTL